MPIKRSRQLISKHLRNRSSQPASAIQLQALLDALPANIAALDASGTILTVNLAWHRFAEANGYADAGHGVGLDYFEICRQASESAYAHAAERAIRALITHEQSEYIYEYPCHAPEHPRWFRFHAARFMGSGPISVIVSHEEITRYKQIEDRSYLMETAHQLASEQAEHALGETRDRMQALFEHAQDALLLTNDTGYYIDANPAACALTGYSRAELLCLNVAALTPPSDLPQLSDMWQAFLDAGVRRGEYMILCKDGNLVPVEFVAVAQIVPGVHLSVLRNITRRRQAEEHVRNHAERLDMLHEIERAIISAGSVEGIAQVTLRALYRLIPYGRGSVIVFDFDLGEFQLVAACQDGVPLEAPERRFLIADVAEAEAIIPTLRRGEHYLFDLRSMASHWPEAEALLSSGMRYQICTPLIFQGELIGSVQLAAPTQEDFDTIYKSIMREMLDSLAIGMQQARLFEQVRVGRERLHELSRRQVEAQELERRQLARDLHDQIGQNLAVLNINLTIARNQLASELAANVDGRLADAIRIVDQTVEQMRNVLTDLHPAILDDFGLVAALRWYARHFARNADLAVLLEVEEPRSTPRLPSDLEIALFRIAQEALTNVVKHAHATLATLNLTIIDQTIRLVISDDGVGFNPSAPRRPKQRWSLGLLSMQERVAVVGGRLVIDSAPGQGTRIIAEVAR